MWAENTSTHQGIYCMSPEGDYLSGTPGLSANGPARQLISEAWSKWQGKGLKMKPIPTDPLPLFGGDTPAPGAMKLQVAYRDLPRGEVLRPTSAKFQNPYNLGWYDFKPEEVRSFLTDSREPVAIPNKVFTRLATATLKDAVRGQSGNFKSSDLKSGSLKTQLISKTDGRSTFRLTGNVLLKDAERSYEAKLHGLAIYNTAKRHFVRFDLIAAGQREGKSGANGRTTDLGPAPLGIAFRMYNVPE
jgi:hypothetical protein